jgi:hypothetical protein
MFFNISDVYDGGENNLQLVRSGLKRESISFLVRLHPS